MGALCSCFAVSHDDDNTDEYEYEVDDIGHADDQFFTNDFRNNFNSKLVVVLEQSRPPPLPPSFEERRSEGLQSNNTDKGEFENKDECPTCLEEYTLENPKITTKCSHNYHLACIYEWMERSQLCPICSRVMEFDESKT